MFTLPDIIKSRMTAIKWIACLVLFALWTGAVYRFASNNTSTACERDAAILTAASASTAASQSEGLRVGDGNYFRDLQRGNNAFQLTAQTDLSMLADARNADDGLRLSIEEAISASTCSLPDSAAAERASKAARALGASLAECSQRRTQVAADLADALNRGQTCQAAHEAVERRYREMNQPEGGE